MNKDVITFPTGSDNQNIAIDYSDEDLIIIDNVKILAEPSATRVKMNVVAACTAGKAQAHMNGKMFELSKNQVLLCPPNVTLSDFLISPDFEFKAVFLTNRLLQSFLRERMNVWNEVMYVHRMHVITMNQLDIEFFAHFYDMLRLCIDNRNATPFRTDVVQSLLRSAFLGLCGELKVMLPTQDMPRGKASDHLFRRFLEMLGKSSVKHRTVESYAAELFVSPKYLSAVCKRCSGKTANEWITESVTEEIRYCLKQTDMPIKQVCDYLGFPNPSFFGKYVKEHFGVSPRVFRESGT